MASMKPSAETAVCADNKRTALGLLARIVIATAVLVLALGALLWALYVHPDTDARVRRLSSWHLLVICGIIAISLVSWAMAAVSRRFVYWVTVGMCFFVGMAWIMFAGALYFASEAMNRMPWRMGPVVGILGVGLLALVGLVEWKVSPALWRANTFTGRIDIEEGVFHHDIPPARSGAGVGKTGRSPVWIGPAIGAPIGLLLVRVLGASGNVVAALVCASALLLFAGLGWAYGSLGVRVLLWERRTGRKMLIDRGENEGPSASAD